MSIILGYSIKIDILKNIIFLILKHLNCNEDSDSF